MLYKKLLNPSNRRIRWIVGAGLLALVCVQCTRPNGGLWESELLAGGDALDQEALSAAQCRQIEHLAKSDPVALLAQCARRYDRTVRDYTCTFIKRERLGGKLGSAQEIAVKFRDEPFSVAMRWLRNAPISDRCLYVEGQFDDNMLVRPKGLLSWVGTQRRKPDSPQVLANTLRPITLFGFRRALAGLIDVYELAGRQGDLTASVVGYKTVADRRTLVIQRELPAKDEYPVAVTRIYIDPVWMVPLCIESFDWNGELESRYIYKDVKFNVALSDEDFTPAANGL